MEELFLPTLHTFAMENVFTGSCGEMRYRVKPTVVKNGKDVNMGESSITAQFWHGPFCYEKSVAEAEKLAKLYLVDLTQGIIKECCELLGMKCPEEM